jgi:hypothetical protein
MGVIYNARQTDLKRLVAIKMIQTGSQVAPEETARSLTEEDAVARLQRSKILQGEEVGEHQGVLFFSLEFVMYEDRVGSFQLRTYAPTDDGQRGRLGTDFAGDVVRYGGFGYGERLPDALWVSPWWDASAGRC